MDYGKEANKILLMSSSVEKKKGSGSSQRVSKNIKFGGLATPMGLSSNDSGTSHVKRFSRALPLLGTFLSAEAAAIALGRDLESLSDKSMMIRSDSIARLILCISGIDCLATDVCLDSISLPRGVTLGDVLRDTSHKPQELSTTLGLLETLSHSFSTIDPAYSSFVHEISEVAALLSGKGDGGLYSSEVAATNERETQRGGACKLVELSGLTKAVATCLERSYAFKNDDTTTKGVSSMLPSFHVRLDPLFALPDSDDEDNTPANGLGRDTPIHNQLQPSLSQAMSRTAFLRKLWLPHLMKPILQRWTDSCEPVRISSLRLTASILPSLDDFSSTLPFLIPALLDRANGGACWAFDGEQKIFAKGSEALLAHKLGRVLPGFASSTQGILASNEKDHLVTLVSEPSEEGRAAVCSVIHALLVSIGRGLCTGIDAYALDVILSIHALSVDSAPNLRVLAVPLIVQAVNVMPHIMKHFSVAFIRSLMGGGLDHRHAKVRLATLDAIDALIHCPDEAKQKGGGSEAILYLLGGREANVVPVAAFYGRDVSRNYAAKLALEGNSAVRLRWVGALGGWCTRLPDRYDWWSFLVPYLLSEVAGGGGEGAEPCPSAEAAMAFLNGLGAALESEKAGEIMDKLQYGTDDLDGGEWKWNGSPLPNPFDSSVSGGRPRLGTRMFVRAQARRVLTPLLGELRVWSPFAVVDGSGMGTRARAAAYLAALLVYFEEGATGEIGAITSVCTSCIDLVEKPGEGGMAVTPSIRACVRLVGRYVPLANITSFLSGLLDEECGASLVGDQGKGIPSSVLFVLSLVLGETVRGGGEFADVSLGSLIALIDSGYKKVFPGDGNLNKALLQWTCNPESLMRYHGCFLESNGVALHESKANVKESPNPSYDVTIKELPPSIIKALSRVRVATALEEGYSKITAGQSTSSSYPCEHLSAARARYLSCVIFTSRLLSSKPELLSKAVNTFLPQLLSLRGELQAEGGDDSASSALISCPHWGVLGHPSSPSKLIETFLSPVLSSSCPNAYQQALSTLHTSLTQEKNTVYSPCPFSGLLDKAKRPIPLGVLTDMALLALAQASFACGAESEESRGADDKKTNRQIKSCLPFSPPMPLPPLVLHLIARKYEVELPSREAPSLSLSITLSAACLQLARGKSAVSDIFLTRVWPLSSRFTKGLSGSVLSVQVLIPLLASVSKKSCPDIALQLVLAGIDFALSSEVAIGSKTCAVWAARGARALDVSVALSTPRLLSQFILLWTHWCTLGVIEDHATLDGSLEQEGGIDFSSPTLKQELEGAMMGLISLNAEGCCTVLKEFSGKETQGLFARLLEHVEVLGCLTLGGK